LQKVITDDLDAFTGNLPPQTREKLKEQEDFKQLIEVVLDWGGRRSPFFKSGSYSRPAGSER